MNSAWSLDAASSALVLRLRRWITKVEVATRLINGRVLKTEIQRVLNCHFAAKPVVFLSARTAKKWGRSIRTMRPAARIIGFDDPFSLDAKCKSLEIRHIDFLTLDTNEVAAGALHTAKDLLGHARIDLVAMSGEEGEPLNEYEADILRASGYKFYGLTPDALVPVEAHRAHNNFILAINERLQSLLVDGSQNMLDLATLCRQHDIQPRGVIHVGAHEGLEWSSYQGMGITTAIFIEANPAVFARLSANLGAVNGVTLVNCAIAATSGRAMLHVTSADQSSSLLPLSRHLHHYPTIVETEVIEVETRALDDLLYELQLTAASFNLLNIDIQGAELNALKGAKRLLAHIDAINVEVNFEELYAGCAQIEEIDDFLLGSGFQRVAITCPFHRSWGDAFYVSRNFKPQPLR